MSNRRVWTENEKEILLQMFPDNYTKDVCLALKRSYSSVSAQAYLMDLKKSESFRNMELAKQAEKLKLAGLKYRYKKGREPENKGKPMNRELYDKCKPTMFKKGRIPHNTNYDGHERQCKDGYTEIRISPGKYVLKHRHIWEKSNGKIPIGYIVVFKDRNKENLSLENLQLISREENMHRNTIQRFPAELKSTIRLVKKLNRSINAKEQN